MFITGPGFSADKSGMGALTSQSDAGPKLTAEQQQQVNDLLVQGNNNLSMCFLKQERYEKAVDRATKVLEIESDNARALYRRGTARMNLNDYDRARADLETAEKLEPEDKQIKSSIAKMNKRLKQHEQKERKAYAKMFAPAAAAGSRESDVVTTTAAPENGATATDGL
eukprot:SAG31_NODE_4838_length_2913_cov_2.769367_3_plen_168_part_00